MTSGTTYADTGLTAGSTHSYTVTAYDAVPNESAPSSPPATATTAAAPDTQAPTVPSNVQAAANGSSEIDLSWTASTDNTAVTGYHVFRDSNPTPLANVTSGTTYADTGLTAGSTHSYTVTAYDAVPNESAPSSPPATATTAAAPDTQAPTVPSNVQAAANGSSEIDLSWTASTDNTAVTGYHVFRDSNPTPLANVTERHNIRRHRPHSRLHPLLHRHRLRRGPERIRTINPPATATTAAAPTRRRRRCRPTCRRPRTAQRDRSQLDRSTDNTAVTGYHVFRDSNPTPLANVTERHNIRRHRPHSRLHPLLHRHRLRRRPQRIRTIKPARHSNDRGSTRHAGADGAEQRAGGRQRQQRDRSQLDRLDRQHRRHRLPRVPRQQPDPARERDRAAQHTPTPASQPAPPTPTPSPPTTPSPTNPHHQARPPQPRPRQHPTRRRRRCRATCRRPPTAAARSISAGPPRPTTPPSPATTSSATATRPRSRT